MLVNLGTLKSSQAVSTAFACLQKKLSLFNTRPPLGIRHESMYKHQQFKHILNILIALRPSIAKTIGLVQSDELKSK